ncbi:MAG TPA: RES family NAD+ phosphorylase [Gemmatimonadota bacterium]|nr:RES family NAD+ phosphorylase [Gemmatimonadota bacterium]
MRVWRITRRPYRALDGEGARLGGGRWNSEGVPVVYASASLSLAALEYLAHLEIEDAPRDLVTMEIDVPDDIRIEEMGASDLPKGWRTTHDHPACLALGDQWAREGRALALKVPSALIPEESSVLLNPVHPEMRRVRVVSTRPFAFDPRLLPRRQLPR